ncbi:hypothetical protein EDF24_3222 [Curtobacterium sp. PhB130]|uniref:hypothetical protein n=1 Tax=unclassified Curtobacterium TaxID=257496 RepID=UPI000FB87309|nr:MULTISPECIES: hypothetical protein [unclassified Curtobacterium]ROS73114.1 hypothetical protein EDF24_3222 [Curtobacterium sp. PhB130]TCK61305.1 hypothetical protein EDF27_3017 [Curtobacterium sp. PhB136]
MADLTMHDGWCEDCDARTVVIDTDAHGEHAWATCVECGAGWVHRDDATAPTVVERELERRAA